MKNRKAALAAALALVGLPVVIVPIEAFSFYSANRDNGSFVSSGEKREYLAVGRVSKGHKPVERAGRQQRIHRRLSVGSWRQRS